MIISTLTLTLKGIQPDRFHNPYRLADSNLCNLRNLRIKGK